MVNKGSHIRKTLKVQRRAVESDDKLSGLIGVIKAGIMKSGHYLSLLLNEKVS